MASVTYTYTTLEGTSASGINNNDQIVGNYSGGSDPLATAFLFSGGSYTTFALPGDFNKSANGINDAGQIVGNCQFLMAAR